MPQVINTNISSLNAQRNLNRSQDVLQKSLQRLSTGLRINSAKDDAAGLAISERMTAQIRGLNQAVRNANDGISLSQTAEGALGTVSEALLRIRELSIQSANATNSGSDRQALQAEVNQLLSEIQRVSTTTEFNGLKLFDGSFNNQSFQVGANANQTISLSMQEVSTSSLGSYTYTAADNGPDATAGMVHYAAGIATSAANSISAQTATLGGSFGTQAIAVGANDTAKDIAASINAVQSTTSITATAETIVTLSSFDTGTVTMNLATNANATFVSINAAVTATDVSALATAINQASGQTGITAQLTSDNAGVVLRDAEGNNIVIDDYQNSAGAGSSVDIETSGGYVEAGALGPGGIDESIVISGSIELTSFESFTVQSDDAAGDNIFDLAANVSAGASQNQLSTVDIATQSGAQAAINIVDAALDRVNSVRGDLGAIQNRFESAISNMSNISENLSAARSRIRDADFAFETAELTKAQILQQAGIAILGQSNALPQNALALLQ